MTVWWKSNAHAEERTAGETESVHRDLKSEGGRLSGAIRGVVTVSPSHHPIQ
jgi:hypothetical protein